MRHRRPLEERKATAPTKKKTTTKKTQLSSSEITTFMFGQGKRNPCVFPVPDLRDKKKVMVVNNCDSEHGGRSRPSEIQCLAFFFSLSTWTLHENICETISVIRWPVIFKGNSIPREGFWLQI